MLLQEDPCSYKNSSKLSLTTNTTPTSKLISKSSTRADQNKTRIFSTQRPRSGSAGVGVGSGSSVGGSGVGAHGGGSVRMGILDRKQDRRIMNALVLSRQPYENVSDVSLLYVEGTTLHTQVRMFRELDVVLSVHGAGLTNIA